MERRVIYIVFNCFNNHKVMNAALDRFRECTDDYNKYGYSATHILVNSKYPLPSVEENKKKFLQRASESGWTYWELSENKGQNGNFNLIIERLKTDYEMKPDDIVAFWEPDAKVNNSQWLNACERVFRKTPHQVGFITPHRMPAWVLNNQGQAMTIDDIRCRRICWPGGFPMGIYKWSFIEDMKSLYVSHKFYGGTEGNILHALNVCNYWGMMLCDYMDLGIIDDFDPEYLAWKQDTIHLPSESQKDFHQWLKDRGIPC